jgi:SAM-dependent methyltransferase
VLRDVLPRDGLVLEIASGSGEHAVHFASLFPRLIWQPSDPDPHALASIEAWRNHSGFANVLPPMRIDATAPEWPIKEADAVLCINMTHISPWPATQGLMAGAQRLLKPGKPVYLYGPFKQAGVALAPSNAAFDASLRERNPDWGLRAVEDVIALAQQHGFGRHRIVSMPANNLSVIFRA